MILHHYVSVIYVFAIMTFICDCSQDLKVKSPAGTFRGRVLTSFSGAEYAAYRGIPYALPPTGDRRFQLPEPHPVIEDTFDATEFGPVCWQKIGDTTMGQEDCLFLNVFTPLPAKETEEGKLKSVLVFIHGGGLIFGMSNIYVPGDLVTKGAVVVVTLNYRLSWLGFLYGNTPSLPGNLAYWDQLLALRWIKDNIREFGGNPDDVTLSGESAGAISVSVLSIAEQAKDLFNKGILLSSSIFTYPGPARTSNNLLEIAAKKFGCDFNPVAGNEEAIVSCLKQIPTERFDMEFSVDFIEALTSTGGDLLPRSLTELISDKDYLSRVGFYNRDYVVSITADDGAFFTDSLFYKLDSSSVSSCVKGISNVLRLPKELTELIFKEYQKLYGDLKKSSIIFLTDAFFLNQSVVFLDTFGQRSGNSASPTATRSYLMSFDHAPRYVSNQYMLHALDLVYLFDINAKAFFEPVYYCVLEDAFYDEDAELRSEFIDMIIDFVKTRNPGERLSRKKGLSWPLYSEGKRYLSFSPRPTVRNDVWGDRRVIWDTLVPKWRQESRAGRNREDL